MDENNQILIPKSINSVKGSIKGWFTWVDLFFGIPVLLIMVLPLILGTSTELSMIVLYGGIDLLTLLLYVLLIYPIFPGKKKLYQKMANVIRHTVDHTGYGYMSNDINNVSPFTHVDGNILMGEKSKIGVIKIKGQDIFLGTPESQQLKVSGLSDIFDSLQSQIDFVKVARRLDYEKWSKKLTFDIASQLRTFLYINRSKIDNYESQSMLLNDDTVDINERNQLLFPIFNDNKIKFDAREVADIEAKLESLDINIKQIVELNELETYETTYFVILKNSSVKLLGEDLATAESMFQNMGHDPKVLDGKEIISFMSSYYRKNNIKLSDKNEEIKLFDIYPARIKFKPKYIEERFPDTKRFVKIISISELPMFASRGWLSNLLSYVDDNVIIKTALINSSEAIDKINKKIKVAEVNALDSRDEISKHTSSKNLESLQSLMSDLQNGHTVQRLNIFIELYANSPEELRKKYLAFRRSIRSLGGYKIDPLNFQQKLAYASMIPRSADKFSIKTSQVVPTMAIAEGYPPTESKFQDPGVPIIAYAPNGTPVFLDLKTRTEDRVNSNMTIIGQSGGGKSFFVKKLTKDLITTGTKVIIIDPEAEYTNLSESLSGQSIAMGGSSEVYLNPLQAFDISELESPDTIINHIPHVQRFIELAGNLATDEAAFLPVLINDLLNKFKIDYKNAGKIPNEKWPTIIDLNKLIQKVAEARYAKKDFGWETYMKFAQKIQHLVDDKKKMQLWGHATNIKMSNVSLTTFNLNSLMEGPNPTIKTAQMYLLLNFVWNIVLENKRKFLDPWKKQLMLTKNLQKEINVIKIRAHKAKTPKEKAKVDKELSALKEKLIKEELYSLKLEELWNMKWIAVVFDEAHLMLDSNNMFAAKYLYTMVKRIRKYNGILIITTQNIKDFTGDANLLKETSAMLNNVQYFVSFGLNPEDVGALNDLRKQSGGITQAEKEFLNSAKRGQALAFLTSSKRMILNIKVSPEEKQIMGEGLTPDEKTKLIEINAD